MPSFVASTSCSLLLAVLTAPASAIPASAIPASTIPAGTIAAGTLPARTVPASLMAWAENPPAGKVEGRVTVKTWLRTKPARENVVLWLEGVPDDVAQVETGEIEIHQKDKRFRPKLAVVTTGTTVSFPNDDHVFHNVFSLSKSAPFDLGLYKSGTTRKVQMRKPGVVDVYCNIHPEMAAKVVVRDGRYHAVTDRKGRFEIPDVPSGTYDLVAWHPGGGETRVLVIVPPGSTVAFDVFVDSDAVKTQHVRKDGTPYGRYK